MTIFTDGPTVDLPAVLANRDWRSAYQHHLEERYPAAVVIAVKLNLAGNAKNSPQIQQLFQAGWQAIVAQVADLGDGLARIKVDRDRPTGPEGFLVVKADIVTVKKSMMTFEADFALGRLFDCDVMGAGADIYQLSRTDLGFTPRTCLICDCSAKDCAKAGRHSFPDLQAAADALYQKYFVTDVTLPAWSVTATVQTAQAACLAEVTVNPKPGLVDPVSPGSHPDMTALTFIDSTLALGQYFTQAVMVGRDFTGSDLKEILTILRPLGQEAEQAMIQATDGVNTHKGVIFSLGILLAAYGQATQNNQATTLGLVQKKVQEITAGLIDNDFGQKLADHPADLTAGERQYQVYQLTGVRGEVTRGLQPLSQVGLPTLRTSPAKTTNDRLLDTLMALVGSIQDSTLIKRAGTPAIEQTMQSWVGEFQALGGAKTPAGKAYL
ncbi:citrate lyase holo-[acyl-carrier protein] synthase, partial [Fructobacillus ficulneus]